MTMRVKDTIDSPTSRTIDNSQYRAINFNGNYPCRVKFVDEKNNINAIVYDHSFSIEIPPLITGLGTTENFPYRLEIYDNGSNTLLTTLQQGINKPYRYETTTTVPSELKIVIKHITGDDNTDDETYYSKLTVTAEDTLTGELADGGLPWYSYWTYYANHNFTLNPVWGKHWKFHITESDQFVSMNWATYKFIRRSSFIQYVEIRPYSGLEIYALDETKPTEPPKKWTGYDMDANTDEITMPRMFLPISTGKTFNKETDKFLTLSIKNVGTVRQAMAITSDSYGDYLEPISTTPTYTLTGLLSNKLYTQFNQTVDITMPNRLLLTDEGKDFGYDIDTTIPSLYSIYLDNIKVRKYGEGSYVTMTNYQEAMFTSSSFDIQIDPSTQSASGSTTRKFTVSGLHLNTGGGHGAVGSATAWYQNGSVFNPWGTITASNHRATVSLDTYSLAGDIYGQVLTGGIGNWTVKIYNNSPVDIECQYYSKKTKENETTFDKTITVNKNSNSGNLTLQDQAWFDDKWFRVQAKGWYSTVGGSYIEVYGAVKKIPDDNSKGYLY